MSTRSGAGLFKFGGYGNGTIAFLSTLSVVLGLFGYLFTASYQEARHEAQIASGNMARILASDIESTLDRAQSDIRVFVPQVTVDDLSGLASEARRADIEGRMALHLQSFPAVTNYRVFNAEGLTVFGAGSVMTRSVFAALTAAFLATSSSVLAEPPRMVLTITQPIGRGDGSYCVESSPASTAGLVLTENDIESFRPLGSAMTLDVQRFARRDGNAALIDHCYELRIDGKVIGRGSVLWTDSPMLTGHPVLIVTDTPPALELQFLSGNHRDYFPIYEAELKRVLGGKPSSSRKP